MMKYLICGALLCFAVASAQVVQCPSGLPSSNYIEIVGCTEHPCTIYDGDVIGLIINFDAPVSTNTVAARLNILYEGLSVPYDLGELADGCISIIGGCPLVAGETYTMEAQVPIDNFLGLTVEITLELIASGDDGNDFSCGRLNVIAAM